jgi:hypothetical protein
MMPPIMIDARPQSADVEALSTVPPDSTGLVAMSMLFVGVLIVLSGGTPRDLPERQAPASSRADEDHLILTSRTRLQYGADDSSLA